MRKLTMKSVSDVYFINAIVPLGDRLGERGKYKLVYKLAKKYGGYVGGGGYGGGGYDVSVYIDKNEVPKLRAEFKKNGIRNRCYGLVDW